MSGYRASVVIYDEHYATIRRFTGADIEHAESIEDPETGVTTTTFTIREHTDGRV